MTEEQWFAWDDPGTFLRTLYSSSSLRANKVFNERRLRLFAVACCRRCNEGRPSDLLEQATSLAEAWADTRSTSIHEQLKATRLSLGQEERLVRDTQTVLARIVLRKHALTAANQSASYAGRIGTRVGAYFRDIVGSPFRPVTFSPHWRTSTAVAIARGMYEARDFSAMPILADALQDAGCEEEAVLTHCRDPHQVHVRGCWVIDGVLGKA